MMDMAFWGIGFRDLILSLAQKITSDEWPGLIGIALLLFLVGLSICLYRVMARRRAILDRATLLIQQAGDAAGLQAGLADIQKKLRSGKSRDDAHLAHAIDEYRETLLEPARFGEGNLRNSVRPSTFLNLEDLRFGLSGWRFWSGLFVSTGLFFTFLGLIAALAATQHSLEIGGGDQKKMVEALEHLLNVASAKFTMSLTGLFCSILFIAFHKYCSHCLENSIFRLAREFESRIDFVSLERLSDQQLAAIKEQTAQQELLNVQLIAELSKPLERITASGTEAIGGMVGELGRSLSSSVGQSLDRMAEKIDMAASSFQTLISSLSEASDQFSETLNRSTAGFGSAVQKIEDVSGALASSAESVASTAKPVMETARATADTARALADGSIELVGAAKVTVDAERAVVISSAKSIEEAIRSFESRAKAYDGQLESAFKVYLTQVQRTLGELTTHSDGVHDRYAQALETLQAVIDNARAFVPESAPTQHLPVSSGAE